MKSRLFRAKLGDPHYPEALNALPNPPPVVVASAPIPQRRAVAIVGARAATKESLAFATTLATALAKARIVVVSGGALGVDGAAHRAALAAGGDTWVVTGNGRRHPYPPEHVALFEEVEASEHSRMIWPFEDDANNGEFIYRNGVIVAFAEALVVIQARIQSGSRSAARWARSMNRPVWAMTAYPGMGRFAGTYAEIEQGLSRPLSSVNQLFHALKLPEPERPWDPLLEEGFQKPFRSKKNAPASLSARVQKQVGTPADQEDWSQEEKLVYSDLLGIPTHIDEIVGRLRLPPGSAVTALLTLSSKDVVVEGPDGFFRRRTVT